GRADDDGLHDVPGGLVAHGLFGKPVATRDQVRGRLFPGHASGVAWPTVAGLIGQFKRVCRIAAVGTASDGCELTQLRCATKERCDAFCPAEKICTALELCSAGEH